MCGLDTFMQSVIATQDTEVYILDGRNIDRLVVKPRVTSSIYALQDKVALHIRARIASRSGSQVYYILYSLSFVCSIKQEFYINRLMQILIVQILVIQIPIN